MYRILGWLVILGFAGVIGAVLGAAGAGGIAGIAAILGAPFLAWALTRTGMLGSHAERLFPYWRRES